MVRASLLIKFGMLEQSGNVSRDLPRDGVGSITGAGGERVRSVVQHALREVAVVSSRLDAKTSEHGIALPASEELDVIFVDAGAQESSGAARPERAGGEEARLDASEML